MRLAPSRRSRRATVALLATAGALASPGAASALPAGTVKFPSPITALGDTGSVSQLAEAPDGNVYVVTHERPRLTTTVRLRRLGPAGFLGEPTMLTRGANYAAVALLPQGGAFVARSNYGIKPLGQELATISLDGQVLASERWGTKRGNTAGPQVGPTGAVLMMLQRRVRHRVHIEYAFRPAGAAAFGPNVELTSRKAPLDYADFVGSSDRDMEFEVAFGPDGGAAVLALPDAKRFGAPYVRLISPLGALGPRLDLGIGAHTGVSGTLAFGPTGTLTAAVVTSDQRKAQAPADSTGQLFVSTITPGAAAASPAQRLLDADYSTFRDAAPSIAAGPGDHVAIITATGTGEESHPHLFESDGGAFTETTAPAAQVPEDFRLFERPDGALTALYTVGENEDIAESGTWVATRPAGGAFTAPRRVTPRQRESHFIELQEAIQLTDGRIAITYGDYYGNNGPLYATTFRP